MGSSCAHEGSSARPLNCSKGNADAGGGTPLHIIESPCQLAAPVLLNCRASPRTDAEIARECPQRDRAGRECEHAQCISLSSAQEERKIR